MKIKRLNESGDQNFSAEFTKRLNENSNFMWDNLGDGKFRVVDKEHNIEADVVKDWQHKGRYEIVMIGGKRFGGRSNSNLTRSEVNDRISKFSSETDILNEMTIGYDKGSIDNQIKTLENNIEDYEQLMVDEPADKEYWKEMIDKCRAEIDDLKSYKPLGESAHRKKLRVIKEASYGGAFDIEDDQFFTRDELNEFGYDVVDALNTISYSRFKYEGCYMENGVLELDVEWDGNVITAKTRVDMRKIRKPSDLYRTYGTTMVKQLQKEFYELGADFGLHLRSDDYPYGD